MLRRYEAPTLRRRPATPHVVLDAWHTPRTSIALARRARRTEGEGGRARGHKQLGRAFGSSEETGGKSLWPLKLLCQATILGLGQGSRANRPIPGQRGRTYRSHLK